MSRSLFSDRSGFGTGNVSRLIRPCIGFCKLPLFACFCGLTVGFDVVVVVYEFFHVFGLER